MAPKFLRSTYSSFVSHGNEDLQNDSFVSRYFTPIDLQSNSVPENLVHLFTEFSMKTNLARVIQFLNREIGFGSEFPAFIVDGGVYMGMYSAACYLILKNLGLNTTGGLAFELNPNLHDLIESNLELYQVPFHLIRKGLSNSTSEITFYVKEHGAIGSGLIKPTSAHTENIGEVTTLNQYLNSTKSLIKLDLEGFEPEAFEGMVENSENSVDHALIIEFAPWQGRKKVHGCPYIHFLNQHFDIYNLVNWVGKQPIEEVDEMLMSDAKLLSKYKQDNVDLLLVPKHWQTSRTALA